MAITLRKKYFIVISTASVFIIEVDLFLMINFIHGFIKSLITFINILPKSKIILFNILEPIKKSFLLLKIIIIEWEILEFNFLI